MNETRTLAVADCNQKRRDAPLKTNVKRGGRKRSVDVRQIVNGLSYIPSTGCQWRYVPKDLPPKSTLYDYFDLWTYHGVFDRIHHTLSVECRER